MCTGIYLPKLYAHMLVLFARLLFYALFSIRFVPAQSRSLYELLESQLWSTSSSATLRSVLHYSPDLLTFTSAREFKTRLPAIR